MNKFTIEEIYRCSRIDYCRLSGITPMELVDHLLAEVVMLERSLVAYRHEYRISGSITTDQQRWRAAIIKEINAKIDAKRAKIKDIKREFSFKD
jgi:hypothetical protein